MLPATPRLGHRFPATGYPQRCLCCAEVTAEELRQSHQAGATRDELLCPSPLSLREVYRRLHGTLRRMRVRGGDVRPAVERLAAQILGRDKPQRYFGVRAGRMGPLGFHADLDPARRLP